MGGAASRNKKFLNSALTLFEMQVASRLHDFWRTPRRQPDGTFEPRIKVVNGREFDIANMTFRQLPAKLQYENLISTKILCIAVVQQHERRQEFHENFITKTATTLHKAYQSRNIGNGKSKWTELNPAEQDKVKKFVRMAIEIHNDMYAGLPASRGRRESEEPPQIVSDPLRAW